jgi:hypothetical protein
MRVTWEQALAWRMRRHHLEELDGGGAVDVARQLCGVQAQVASSAALAVAARQQEPDADAAAKALEKRDLVRTWAMRGTLHLLPTEDAGSYLALLAGARTWTKGSWQKYYLSVDEMERLTEAVRTALESGDALTRDELVARIDEHSGATKLTEHVSSGWGTVLKPLAWQGILCQGPSEGGRVTFMRPDAWSPRWAGLPEEDVAAAHVVRGYLAAHGPATMTGFDQWLLRGGTPKAKLRRWFADLGEDVVTLDVEGTATYLLAEHEDELRSTRPSTTVRLLPGFDQYVLAPGTGDATVLDPAHRADVSRAAGWIAPVVVAGGRVVGTWAADNGTPVADVWAKRVPAAKLAAEKKRMARLTAKRPPA